VINLILTKFTIKSRFFITIITYKPSHSHRNWPIRSKTTLLAFCRNCCAAAYNPASVQTVWSDPFLSNTNIPPVCLGPTSPYPYEFLNQFDENVKTNIRSHANQQKQHPYFHQLIYRNKKWGNNNRSSGKLYQSKQPKSLNRKKLRNAPCKN